MQGRRIHEFPLCQRAVVGQHCAVFLSSHVVLPPQQQPPPSLTHTPALFFCVGGVGGGGLTYICSQTKTQRDKGK